MAEASNVKIDNDYFRQQVTGKITENQKLWAEIGSCGLSFVYADGRTDSKVVMIGEAPGRDEVRYGRPFAGKAGDILDEILVKTGIPREELYITNTVKYRLAAGGKRPGTIKNRPVKQYEILYSLDWLRRELEVIKPSLIITLGNVPLKAILLIKNCAIMSISDCHGTAQSITVGDKEAQFVPLYHPASQIYNHDLKPVFEKDFYYIKSLYRTIRQEEK